MSPFWRKEPSLLGTFAALSLAVIVLSAAIAVTVQWKLFREDLLERERTSVAEAIRIAAHASLRAEDFAEGRSPAARERFEGFFRRALLDPDILRVKLYDTGMRVVWSDEAGSVGVVFPDNGPLGRALRGETVAHLEHGERPDFGRKVRTIMELYVPIEFSPGAPGTARIAGVVEVYKDPARMFAALARGRWTIVGSSLASAAILYAALFGIVRRASRRLRAQRADLERQNAALDSANRELGVMQGQLRVRERLAAVGEVSAAVAHGIRNPLANIRASAQVALDLSEARGAVEQHLVAITAEVDRLERWLRSLLDVVRPFEPRLAPVDPNAVLGELLAMLRERVAARDIKLERELAAGLPALTADEVQLQQAFLGVLENALDAMPGGGTLSVWSERATVSGRPGVRVGVRDTGEGIPAERLGRVFEAFFTTKSRGTGLGLAITRKVVEGHGGHVEVESQPGAGTTVRITLPLSGAAPPPA